MKKFSLYNIHCTDRSKIQPLICKAAGFAAPDAGYRETASGAVKDHCGIFYCCGASAEIEISGRKTRLFSGDAVCYRKGERHCIEIAYSGFSYCWAVWNGVLAESFLDALNIASGEKIHAGNSLRESFDRLFDTLRINSVKASSDGGVILDEILSTLALARGGGGQTETKDGVAPLIAIFKELVMSEYHDPSFNLDAVSSKLGVHRSTLDRAVKKHLGIAPGEYLQDIRVKVALGRLKASARPVNEIGSECGFSSASYFARVIKEKTGFSPKEYREKA